MLWNENHSKPRCVSNFERKFFEEVDKYLKPNGRIYFGWADFADIDVDLPFKLADENGYELVNKFSKPHGKDFTFYVLEFCLCKSDLHSSHKQFKKSSSC